MLKVFQPGENSCSPWIGGGAEKQVAVTTLFEGGQLSAGTNYFVRVRALVSASSFTSNPYRNGVASFSPNAYGMGEPRKAVTILPFSIFTASETPRARPLKPINV